MMLPHNHDKLDWIGVSVSPSLSRWIKDNMLNVNSNSSYAMKVSP